MARRRDLPKALCLVNSRFGTPYVSIWITGFVMALLAWFVDLTGVVVVSTFALLFWYVLVNVAAFRLKHANRMYPRVVPAIGFSTCLVLLVTVFFVAQVAWTVGVAFLLAGTLLYVVKRTQRKNEKG